MTDETELNNIHETVAETPSENPDLNLNLDDSDASADVSRPARAMQFRIQRRSQVSTAIPALLLIGLGLLYLLNPAELTRPLAIGAAVVALAISLVMRFLLNARRERGLFFVGVLLLLWVGLVAVVMYNGLEFAQVWPLAVSAIGLTMIIAFLFERTHDRGLLLPGMTLIIAGAIALSFTLGMFSGTILTSIALYWPVLFLIAAIAILPRAVRDRAK